MKYYYYYEIITSLTWSNCCSCISIDNIECELNEFLFFHDLFLVEIIESLNWSIIINLWTHVVRVVIALNQWVWNNVMRNKSSNKIAVVVGSVFFLFLFLFHRHKFSCIKMTRLTIALWNKHWAAIIFHCNQPSFTFCSYAYPYDSVNEEKKAEKYLNNNVKRIHDISKEKW